jgi:RHS repeat-associated protein
MAGPLIAEKFTNPVTVHADTALPGLVSGQNGSVSSVSYAPHGPLSSMSLHNATVQYQYDVRGRPTLATEAGARQTGTQYDDANRTATTSADRSSLGDGQVKTKQFLDQTGRVFKTLASDSDGSLGIETLQYRWADAGGYTYDVVSNPHRSTSEDTMGWTRTKTDGNGRVMEVQRFGGAELPSPWGGNFNSTGTVQTQYSANQVTLTDEAGKVRRNRTDGLGRVTEVVEDPVGLNYTTSYAYNALDDLRAVFQGAQTRTFEYSSLKRLTSATNPESGTVTYLYDDNGNLVTRTDARGSFTAAYDAINRTTGKSYSDGTPAVAYTYDTVKLGRLSSVGNSVSTTNYTAYDALGRVTAGNQNTGGTAYPFSYAYNLLDGLTSMTYPSGLAVSYAVDGAGRVSAVNGYASSIQYAPHGAPSQVNLANGVTETTAYNSRLQPTSIAAGSLLTLGFGYGTTNNNGNVVSQTITVPGASGTQSYSYDNLNRLDGASEAGAWSRTFGYDAYGNMWVSANNGVPMNGSTPQSPDWFVDPNDPNHPKNRLVHTGVQYLDGGELQQIGGYTFTYDAESRLKTSTLNGVTTTYSYDGEGRRVMKATGGSTVVYVYDAMGKLAAEYGGTVDTGGPQYLTSDHLGSTRLVTNAGGNMVSRHDYLPFGEEIPAGVGFRTAGLGYFADAFPLKFSGKERDTESNLDYFGARYFSGAQGRFTSPDPLLNSGRPDDPQSWNRYAYVNTNPVRYKDPFGLYKWASNCDEANDTACKADRDRFRAAYADLKKAAGNLEEGLRERKQLDKIIKRIGEEDKGKVKIAFGDAGHDSNGNPNAGSTLGNTITLNWNAVSQLSTSYGASFGYDQNQTSTLFNNMAAGLVGHEGGHLAGSGIPGLSLMMHTERTGLYSESATDQGLHYTDLIYKLWNGSWAKIDVQTREEFRNQGIQTELDRQRGKEPPK